MIKKGESCYMFLNLRTLTTGQSFKTIKIKFMTTKEVAQKFHEYMNQGAFEKIYTELYSPDATSEETPGSDWGKANGMAEIMEKGKKWADTVEEMFGGTTGATFGSR